MTDLKAAVIDSLQGQGPEGSGRPWSPAQPGFLAVLARGAAGSSPAP